MFISIRSFAQSPIDLDKLLAVKYSKSEIREMKKNNIERYNLYLKSFTNSNAIVIADYNDAIKAKENVIESLNIKLEENKKFNYLEYNLDLKENNQYYIINDDKNILLIRGIAELKIIK